MSLEWKKLFKNPNTHIHAPLALGLHNYYELVNSCALAIMV